MKIIHLANDYSGSLVYRNLCISLDKLGFLQRVYVPVKSDVLVGQNKIDFEVPASDIIYSNILNTYTRINYKYKIKRVLIDFLRLSNPQEYDIVHAHTWYSDGGLAYEIFKLYQIPYIVTVRNTDLNLFSKYMPHLRGYATEILLHAKQVVFISPVYRKRFLAVPFLKEIIGVLRLKSVVLPNGIDDYWIRNVAAARSSRNETLQLVFVGRFLKSKNLPRLIKAVKALNQNKYFCHLHLAGGGGNAHDNVLKLIQGNSFFSYHGNLESKAKLRDLYRSSDIFVMPSISETFGLVYIEALSQGLPVVYTKNEGIDGLYGNNIGESVDCLEVNDLVNAIMKIADDYESYNFDPKKIASNHNWKVISKKYMELYNHFVN